AALNEFTRSAAAVRGFRSDLNWDVYSQGLIELATEIEQLAVFRTAKGSKVSIFVDIAQFNKLFHRRTVEG
ncbi:hypothetical protein E4U56_006331, partial [Claviceps arundinis]